jgi:hypothetical protein
MPHDQVRGLVFIIGMMAGTYLLLLLWTSVNRWKGKHEANAIRQLPRQGD